MPEKKDKFDELLFQAAAKCDLNDSIPQDESDGMEDLELLEALEARLKDGADSTITSSVQCPYCEDLVDITAQALQEWRAERGNTSVPASAAPETSSGEESEKVTDRFKAVFGSFAQGLQFLCGTSLPQMMTLQPVSVRSSSAALASLDTPCFSEFQTNLGGNRLRVQIERLPSELLDIQVKVLKKQEGKKPVRATLYCRGKVVESVPFEGSVVYFKDLAPDKYKIELTTGALSVGSLDLVFMQG
jgi:hypothetical protein